MNDEKNKENPLNQYNTEFKPIETVITKSGERSDYDRR